MRATLPEKRCPGIRGHRKSDLGARPHLGGIGLGDRHDEPEPRGVDEPQQWRRAGATRRGSHEGSGVHIPFGDHAGERGRHPQIPFHVANGVERLPGRFDTLLSGEDLVRARIRGLFRDHDVVSGHDAWRRRRGLESGERALVGVSLRTRHRQLRFCRLQFRLRFRPLRHEFRRFE